MKRAGIWFWMLLKRQLKKPSLYIVIICMVVCCFVIRSAASGFTVNLAVGIMNEDTGEKQAEDGDDAGIAADITELMESHRGLLRFVVYSDEEELKTDPNLDDLRKFLYIENANRPYCTYEELTRITYHEGLRFRNARELTPQEDESFQKAMKEQGISFVY